MAETTIRILKNEPLLVKGPSTLMDVQGQPLPVKEAQRF